MSRAFRCLAFAALNVVLSSVLIAQQSKSQPMAPAPVPPQIISAKKVFIANGGGERLETLGDTAFNGGPDRPYNEFYADIKSWGHYELVSSPSDADVVLEVSWSLTEIAWKPPDPYLGRLHLIVLDPKTNVALWKMTEYVRGAALLGNRDKNFDQAMDTIMTRLKSLTGTDSAQ